MTDQKQSQDLLSDHLRWLIEDADAEQLAEDAEATIVVEKLIRAATTSLEGFTSATADHLVEFWLKNPDHWRWAIDDHYSRRSVKEVPNIVRRFLKLTPALVGRIPNSEVSTYLREATQCFLYGFFQSTTALSRAALEAGVNELLQRRLGAIPNADLVDKLKQLDRFGILTSEASNDAHTVRKAGAVVLHKATVSESQALDSLIRTRKTLAVLYKI